MEKEGRTGAHPMSCHLPVLPGSSVSVMPLLLCRGLWVRTVRLVSVLPNVVMLFALRHPGSFWRTDFGHMGHKNSH